MQITKAQQEIREEVFSLTGIAIDNDDPLAVAAIFYSKKLQQILDQHLELSIKLQTEIKNDREKLSQTILSKLDNTVLLINQSTSENKNQIRTILSNQLKENKKNQTETTEKNNEIQNDNLGDRWQTVFSKKSKLIKYFALVVFSFAAGWLLHEPTKLSTKEQQLINIGRNISNEFPNMDQETRNKLIKILKNNDESTK